jgi:hypothetical protein
MTTRRVGVLTLVIVCLGAVVLAQGPADVPLASWPAPPYWLPSGAIPAAGTPAAEGPEVAAEQAVVRALPLVAIAPCRLLDTRAAGLPALSAGAAQEIAVVGRCGIPAQAQGVSLRLVVGEGTGGGVLTVGAAGEAGGHGGRLVLDRGQGSSTTGVVGLDGSGRLVAVTEGGSLQLVVEVNGYYAGEPAVRSLNALAGDVLLRAGENIAITSEGSTVTIALAPGGSPGAQQPGEVGPPIPGSPPQGGRVVKVLPSKPVTPRPPEQAMVPPPSSMYVAGALELPNTTAAGAGVLTLGGDRFLHNYGPTGTDSTFVGHLAGNFSMTGSYNTGIGSEALLAIGSGGYNTGVGTSALFNDGSGSNNTGVGAGALLSNGSASQNTAVGSGALGSQSFDPGSVWVSDNTAVGYNALTNNQPDSTNDGHQNTAVGSQALQANTTGWANTASGYQSLLSNTTGYENTANGVYSLYSNMTGFDNTASGDNSLKGNTTGEDNVAFGIASLSSNTTGSGNAAIGTGSGQAITTGNFNTFLGQNSNALSNNLTNATAIGKNAVVDLSNHVRIGDTNVTQIGGQVAWSNLSDARLKENIRDLDLGLDFVLQLRPVSFTMKQGNGRTDMGFLAQDVEALLGDDYNVLGIGADQDRTLSLRGTDLIAPMVKAIQEQDATIKAQRSEIQELKAAVEALRARVQAQTVPARTADLR